ncbi:hypothetical protein PR048_005395 [Dryococelus australis]|uniref:Uncharacterized protein n=1 Tax=Dryococelus australis TaxID=614101 RepID=A0ABQ9I847_9NEOP|nr:hypothetical protein PR048_005395 [Dryococelus australis]
MCKQARNNWQINRNPANKTEHNSKLEELKIKDWGEATKNAAKYPKEMWQLTKTLTGKHKANIMAESQENQFSPNKDIQDKQFTQSVNNDNIEYLNIKETSEYEPITLKELLKIIKTRHNNKLGGPDGIKYKALKKSF